MDQLGTYSATTVRLGVIICAVLMGSCATTERRPKSSKSSKAVPRSQAIAVVTLQGAPTVRLTMDRKYEVVYMPPDPAAGLSAKDLRSYMFTPQDEQSSAVLGIGDGGQKKTEETIASYYQGAKVTKVAGTVAGKPVEWWHYQDDRHHYSTCYTSLPDKKGKERPFYFDLVANRPERLAALEEAFSRIELE